MYHTLLQKCQCPTLQDTLEGLQAASPQTLILVDELGKSTSTTDGLAFAWSIAEEFMASRALVIFATHFKEMGRLAQMYETASVLHMEAIDEATQYRQTHKCLPGPCEVTQYGLKLAKKVWKYMHIILYNQTASMFSYNGLCCKTEC
jgi:DNA mismatch repair protein MutS